MLAPGVDAPAEFAIFKDYEFKNPHSDWEAVWRNWLRKAASAAKPRPRLGRYDEAVARAAAREGMSVEEYQAEMAKPIEEWEDR